MTDETTEPETEKKGKMKPLLIGVVLALVGAAGGFFSVSSGLFSHSEKEEVVAEKKGAEVAYIRLDPVVISLGTASARRHLRFEAQLEVKEGKEMAVTEILPRVVDVMNAYLRAVDVTELDQPGALVRLRAQLLRRMQIVVGEDVVNDLLVMEFVLS